MRGSAVSLARSLAFPRQRRTCRRSLTDKSENVSDGGDEDDQGVGADQQDHGDDGVADPAEVLGGAQEMGDGGADLRGEDSG